VTNIEPKSLRRRDRFRSSSRKRSGPGHCTAEFDPTGTRRYWLRRVWEPDLPLAVWVLFNPSVGSATRMDPTLWRVCHFSRAFGCGGAHVVNLYAYTSPDPRVVLDACEGLRGGPHGDPEQADALRSALHLGRALADAVGRRLPTASMFAAWGTLGHGTDAEAWLLACAIALGGVRFLTLGKTRHGAPRHPLHAPRVCEPVLWP
jgi:hypothetical protein